MPRGGTENFTDGPWCGVIGLASQNFWTGGRGQGRQIPPSDGFLFSSSMLCLVTYIRIPGTRYSSAHRDGKASQSTLTNTLVLECGKIRQSAEVSDRVVTRTQSPLGTFPRPPLRLSQV